MAFLRPRLIFSEAQPRVHLCEDKRETGLTAKKSGHVKNHQGLYTFFLDSRQISPLIFFHHHHLSSSPARYILFLFHTGGLHARNICSRLMCMLLARDLTLVHHPASCAHRATCFSSFFFTSLAMLNNFSIYGKEASISRVTHRWKKILKVILWNFMLFYAISVMKWCSFDVRFTFGKRKITSEPSKN